MTSQLNVDTIVDKAGTGGTNVKIANNAVAVAEGGSATTNVVQGLVKAWARLDGTGTIGLDDSFNNSAATDLGTGNYGYNFTNVMSNANYHCSFAASCQMQIFSAATTTRASILCRDQNNSNEDVDQAFNSVNGDLA